MSSGRSLADLRPGGRSGSPSVRGRVLRTPACGLGTSLGRCSASAPAGTKAFCGKIPAPCRPFCERRRVLGSRRIFRRCSASVAPRTRRSSSITAEETRGDTPGLPDVVVFPTTTAEVANIVLAARRHRSPVVAFGVGSSLEGHVNAVKGGVSVDFSTRPEISICAPSRCAPSRSRPVTAFVRA